VALDHRIEGALEIAFTALALESEVEAVWEAGQWFRGRGDGDAKEWGSELLPDFATFPFGGNPMQ
jgi:hypothetical protein